MFFISISLIPIVSDEYVPAAGRNNSIWKVAYSTKTDAKRVPPVWMKAGDVLEVEISKIGTLRTRVVDER